MSLYQRFCQLDRSGGGFISAEEFLSVPEFAVNPLSQVTFAGTCICVNADYGCMCFFCAFLVAENSVRHYLSPRDC